MTRGRMASAMVALLMGSLKSCVEPPAGLLTSEGAAETIIPLVSIAAPLHTTTVRWNTPLLDSTEFKTRPALHLGDAT